MTMTDATSVDTQVKVTAKSPVLANILGNALVVASKDKFRPAIASVQVTLTEASMVAVATDSYMLVRQEATVETQGEGVFLIFREEAEDIVKMVKADKMGVCTLVFSDREVTVSTSRSSATFRLADFDFPKHEALWPTGDPVPTATIGLGSWNLAKLAKIVDPDFSGKVTQGIRFDLFGALKPSRFKIGSTISGLMMPVKLS